jgi:hypothetical protein
VGSLTGAPDLGEYFQFTITADSGFAFDLDSLTFGFGRSGTGPRTAQWRSSIDDYAAPISSYSSLGGSGLFSQSGGVLTFISDSTATTGTNVVLDLAGPSAGYRGISTVGLRWYGYNAEQSGGTGGFQGPLSFAVTVTSNEPAGTYDPPAGYYATATGTGAALKAHGGSRWRWRCSSASGVVSKARRPHLGRSAQRPHPGRNALRARGAHRRGFPVST